jgi:16S rRNA (adenine1518-N6/adenine1519-N6)-dimethyltransferase
LNLSLDYDSPVSLRHFLDERGFGMQKKFGQNFLVNRSARERLVDALGAGSDDEVWEVGPGLGAMTVPLLSRGCRVSVFEIDRGFSTVLRELFSGEPRFSIIEGDVLKTWSQEVQKNKAPAFFFGNLPYNIAATLIASFIEAGCFFRRAVVTVQKEVADRMVAKPGSKDYSSFSVLCSSAYSVKPLMTLKPHSFYPAPNVDSAAVVMERRPFDGEHGKCTPDGSLDVPPLFRLLVRALFASRRKTVRNNLDAFLRSGKTGYPIPPEQCQNIVVRALEKAGIDPLARAETLSLEEFSQLTNALYFLAGEKETP